MHGNILEWTKRGWNGLKLAGIRWNWLQYDEIGCTRLKLAGPRWNVLQYDGIGYNRLKYAGISFTSVESACWVWLEWAGMGWNGLE